jgi:hypothetical protein
MVLASAYSGLMTDAQGEGTRTIAITATPHPMGRYGLTHLLINVDGVEYAGTWTRRGQWQVPANRPVAVAVAMRNMGSRGYVGAAQFIVQPDGPSELEYKAPAFYTAPGDLGPRGTVVHNGKDSYAKFVGITVAIAVVTVSALTVGLLLLFL